MNNRLQVTSICQIIIEPVERAVGTPICSGRVVIISKITLCVFFYEDYWYILYFTPQLI